MKKPAKTLRGNIRGNNLQNSRIVIKPPQVKTWRVILIRSRGQLLGYVEAADMQAAELAAVRAFNLDEHQRKRLMVRERL